MKRPARAVLAWPMTFACAILAGLVLGLVGDGAPDILSWALLGAVPLAIAIAWSRRARSAPSPKGRSLR
ncbi:hypothetical protein GRI40_08300 [Altererythrobacter aerius]|uniref:DUF4175 domain-containing protein n=1 Tax=Tsuneonella aeria TaxID=1837929 RepID=A0A6I4TGG3_9SPHN|nr:hypothetical protein [Tsuneonella aeria]MXO75215.1 hypothetical protein [Tsuneonella aeria]